MLRRIIALAAAFAIAPFALPSHAQDGESSADSTAEQMIEIARESWHPPGVRRRCPEAKPGEIVVCGRSNDDLRLESPTQRAIRTGERPRDTIPRAPDVFGLPPCNAYAFCSRIGRTPTAPLLIDLEALPEPLTAEDAALVFRAEDMPERDPVVTRAAASPVEPR